MQVFFHFLTFVQHNVNKRLKEIKLPSYPCCLYRRRKFKLKTKRAILFYYIIKSLKQNFIFNRRLTGMLFWTICLDITSAWHCRLFSRLMRLSDLADWVNTEQLFWVVVTATVIESEHPAKSWILHTGLFFPRVFFTFLHLQPVSFGLEFVCV